MSLTIHNQVYGNSSLVSKAAQYIPHKIQSVWKAALHAGLSLVQAAKNPIGWAVQNHPEMFLHLHFLLEEFQKSMAGQQRVSPVHRNELAERLEAFTQEFKPAEKPFLDRLCVDLRNSSVSFDQTKESEMLRLVDILTPHLEKHSEYIFSKMVERQALEKLPGITTAPVAAPSKEETFKGIEDQMNLLRDNSIKMVLGFIMLYTTLGISSIKEINPGSNLDFVKMLGIDPANTEGDLVNLLIEASNKIKIEGKSSTKVFQMLLERIIDNSDRNIFDRYRAKIRCKYLSKLISSYMTNLFDNMKDSLLHFAHLSPAEQLQEVTALLVNPLVDHFTKAPDQIQERQNPRPIIEKLSKILHPSELLDIFIDTFLDQFIDPIHQHWTQTARAACLEKASRATFLVKGICNALAALFWAAGTLIAPLQWTLNETVRLLLRMTLVKICPGLCETTKKTTLGIGNPYAWHSLKKNLLLMLQQYRLNRLMPRSADPSFPALQNIPPAVTEKFNTLIEQLLKALTQGESSGFLDLLKGLNLEEFHVARQHLMTFLQGQLQGTLKATLSTLTVDMLSQEGFLNSMILSSLTSTNQVSFTPNTVVVTEEEKKQVEDKLQKELALLGEGIIEDLKENTSNKSYQTAANIYVNTLKQQVQTFHQELVRISQNPDLQQLPHFQSLFSNLSQSLKELQKTIHQNVDASTEALLAPYLERCLSSVQDGLEILNQPTVVEAARLQLEQKLDRLSAYLQNPFAAEEEIFSTLCEIRALNSPFIDCAALEADIETQMQIPPPYPKAREQHPHALTKHLTQLITTYKEKAQKEARRQEKKMKIELSSLLALSLTEWTNTLNFVKVTAKPGVKDAGLALLYQTPLAKPIASSLIQSYGNNFFEFIGQEHRIDDIVQRALKAYINKPITQKKPLPAPRPVRKKSLDSSQAQKLDEMGWVVFIP